MAKIKVVQVITRLIKGGAQKVCLDITQGLPKNQYEVFLLSGPETGLEGSLWDKANQIQGIRIKVIQKLVREISPVKDLMALISLYYFFHKTHPHIVHCHTSKAGFIGCLASWLARVPVIMFSPHGHLFSPSAKIPSVSHSSLRLQIFYYLTRMACLLSTKVIAQNAADKNEQIKLWLAPARKYEIIHNAVDPAHNPALIHEGWADKRYPVLATIGRLSPEKGQIHLLEAIKSVKNSFPDVLLLVIGDGALRKELEDFTQRENISTNVRFTGLCDNPDIFLKDIDIFVLPSLYESFGIVLLEAMAQKKPAIASNVNGIPEVVVHNQTGILVPPANPQALSEAIIKLATDKELARKMGLAGYERVNKFFRREQMVENFDNLYKKLSVKHPMCHAKLGSGAIGMPNQVQHDTSGVSNLVIEPARKSNLPIIAAMHIDPNNDMITKIIRKNSAQYKFYLDKVNMFYRLEPKGVLVAKELDRILGFIIASKKSDEIKKLSVRKGYILYFALKSLLFQYGLNKEMIKKLFLVPYANFIRQKTELSQMPFKVNNSGKLWASVVIKQARNKGIYSKLIEASCDYARKQGAYILSATFAKDNIIPLNHCQKAGFQIIGECMESTGPSYYLIKQLSKTITESSGLDKYRNTIKQANRSVYNAKTVKQYERNPSIFEASRQEAIKNIINFISAKTSGGLPAGRHGKFLDIGCGTGNLVKIGNNYFQTVIGMDMAVNLLKQVKQANPEISLITADADYPPFKKNTFDCISLYGALHHLFNPSKTIAGISSLLKPGGYLYTDHDPNYFFGRFYRFYYRLRHRNRPGFGSKEEETAEFHNTRTGGINPKTLKEKLLNSGFQDVSVHYRHTTNPSLPMLERLCLLLLKASSRLVPLKSFYTHFYLIGRRRPG